MNVNRDKPNLVTITRARGTRSFYHEPDADVDDENGKGHPTWYGKIFCLKSSETWGEPDEVAETTFTSQRKITYRIEIQAWKNLLVHGKQDIPMHKHAFTLVKIRNHLPVRNGCRKCAPAAARIQHFDISR